MSEEKTPVIVGVGQINDRPEIPAEGRSPIELMAAALRIAEKDAGQALLADADFLGIVQQISFREIRDARDPLAAELGIAPATMLQTEGPNGDSPVMLLNEAANRVGAGECRIALLCGAEALRTAAARAAACTAWMSWTARAARANESCDCRAAAAEEEFRPITAAFRS